MIKRRSFSFGLFEPVVGVLRPILDFLAFFNVQAKVNFILVMKQFEMVRLKEKVSLREARDFNMKLY